MISGPLGLPNMFDSNFEQVSIVYVYVVQVRRIVAKKIGTEKVFKDKRISEFILKKHFASKMLND